MARAEPIISSSSVFEYFTRRLGVPPNDGTLQGLGIDTPCGKDCVTIIDRAVDLLAVCDPHPDVREPVLNAVNAAVEIAWRG
jgi:hypothetical protein